MSKKLTHCAQCDKEFENKDEIVETKASGTRWIVHADCLDDWLNRWGAQDYYGTYGDFLKNMGLV